MRATYSFAVTGTRTITLPPSSRVIHVARDSVEQARVWIEYEVLNVSAEVDTTFYVVMDELTFDHKSKHVGTVLPDPDDAYPIALHIYQGE